MRDADAGEIGELVLRAPGPPHLLRAVWGDPDRVLEPHQRHWTGAKTKLNFAHSETPPKGRRTSLIENVSVIGCGPTAAGPRPPDAEYRRALFGQLCKPPPQPPAPPKLCNPSNTKGFSRAAHFTAFGRPLPAPASHWEPIATVSVRSRRPLPSRDMSRGVSTKAGQMVFTRSMEHG